jgi:hypothetical protein
MFALTFPLCVQTCCHPGSIHHAPGASRCASCCSCSSIRHRRLQRLLLLRRCLLRLLLTLLASACWFATTAALAAAGTAFAAAAAAAAAIAIAGWRVNGCDLNRINNLQDDNQRTRLDGYDHGCRLKNHRATCVTN